MSALGNVGKYELRRQIGRGAMGIVYEAFDTVIERRVALKMLRTDQFAPEQLKDVSPRFKREAHSAGKLSHPNLVTIFDYGEHDGSPFIVMDLMEGEELARSLDAGSRMTLPQILRVMEQLLAALAYAHGKGVVHRDLKPSNVFVLRDGTVKVVDFGLARIEASNLTETGTLLGTPAYMSPEQFLGLPADARSDVFSVGVMLYQMLTGDRPFSGAPSTIMQKVLRQEPVQPTVLNPTLSAAWDDLIRRALAKKPEERIQSAAQFLEFMRLVVEGKPLPGPAPSTDATVIIDRTVRIAPASPAPAAAPQRKSAFIAAAAGITVIVLAGGAVTAYYLSGKSTPPAPAQPVAVAPAQPAAPAPVAQPEAKPEPPKPKPVEKKIAKVEKPKPAVQAKAAEPPPAPPRPTRVEPARVEPPAPAPAAAPAPVAKAAPTPPPAPKAGKVVSLDRNWGFLVVQAPDLFVRVGDRLYANLADGRRVPIVVRRISGNLVSAVPEGVKISDEMVGASVTQQ